MESQDYKKGKAIVNNFRVKNEPLNQYTPSTVAL